MQLASGVAVAVAVATAPIGPLAWEPSYAMGAALKRPKKERKRRGTAPKEHTSPGRPGPALEALPKCGVDKQGCGGA